MTAQEYKLTKSQRVTLARLAIGGARSRDTGMNAYNGSVLQAQTVGSLINLGYADKSVVRHFRSQRTVYWLTQAGLDRYEIERRKAGGRSMSGKPRAKFNHPNVAIRLRERITERKRLGYRDVNLPLPEAMELLERLKDAK
jgi:hypothetical protein